jgi:hypothetical protein
MENINANSEVPDPSDNSRKTDRYQLNSPDLSPKILQTVICEREDSHNGAYRTNIGSEHYGCTEDKH